jgi:hypothetical protein
MRPEQKNGGLSHFCLPAVSHTLTASASLGASPTGWPVAYLRLMALFLPFIEAEILDQYQAEDNARPWIVGFSGGKDSTMLLQLVWKAVQKLPEQLR